MTSTLTADLLLSVDGWAGSDGLPGFFGYLGPDLEQWLADDATEPQLALMGRKTYELLSDLPDEAKDDAWEQMSRRETVVFSRTRSTVDWPSARVSDVDVVEEVRRLKADQDVPLRTVGSLSLVRQLLGDGLIDRLRLLIFPLLAGEAGRERAFADTASADLELVEQRVLDGRVLLVDYHPTQRDIPRA